MPPAQLADFVCAARCLMAGTSCVGSAGRSMAASADSRDWAAIAAFAGPQGPSDHQSIAPFTPSPATLGEGWGEGRVLGDGIFACTISAGAYPMDRRLARIQSAANGVSRAP